MRSRRFRENDDRLQSAINLAGAWNFKRPVGTRVAVQRDPAGPWYETRTRCAAFSIGFEVKVSVDGIVGAIGVRLLRDLQEGEALPLLTESLATAESAQPGAPAERVRGAA
jgi:hypothetical protein